MNPVTQALLKQLNDPVLTAFAEDWDAVEGLILEINKQKSLSFAQQEEFFVLKERLQRSYPPLRSQMEPFWKTARVKGEFLKGDPFEEMIAAQGAQAFVDNWPAVQKLPPAREALNSLLLQKLGRND